MTNNHDAADSPSNRDTEVARVVSGHFCALDSDVKFLSSDGVLFFIHRKNLETNAGGFPPAEVEARDEAISLTENSSVLELLFQFIYPMHHPNLGGTPFSTICMLSEAAEKYEVYAAMNICSIRMQLVLPKYADVVIAYAVKHDYQDILRKAAPLMLNKPLNEIIANMPMNLVIPWVQYYEHWNHVLQLAISYPNRWKSRWGSTCCTSTDICVSVLQVVCRLISVQSLQNLDAVFNIGSACCNDTASKMVAWRHSVEVSMKVIPEFSTFCCPAVS